MRKIKSDEITSAVANLCAPAATNLPVDVLNALKKGAKTDRSKLGQSILEQCVENAEIAKKESVPICQDTGFAVLFIELGQSVQIVGKTLEDACNDGVAKGYTDGYLRKSIVLDPLYNRVNSGDNTPAVIHLSTVPGDQIKIVLAPKGGGSENMSQLKMLKPSDGEDGIVDFVVDAVVNSGGNPCPPTIVGVGIGGTAEKCVQIAKKSLLREVGSINPKPEYATLEAKILDKVNRSGVGPQGLGGDTTALAVHIETYPCHIAQMPCAVNLNCHAARHSEVIL
jgi:fumarate hydratase subunit alpha